MQCKLAELSKKADWFMFLVEGGIADIVEESGADRKAAYAIGALHEALLQANFKGRDLEIFLTRLLFCLFADDTGIFGVNNQFRRLVESTRPDGGDVGRVLAELFQVLDTAESNRQKNLDEALSHFAYINGKLFAEPARIPSFDSALRAQLIDCAKLDWSSISPAIFGSMFQGVLETHDTTDTTATRKASRRELGAHYTSERNILRVINPLCMDALRAELNKASHKDLAAFYDLLPTLTFFDPACGCGNFLVIAFRELRQLEMDTIDRMNDARLTKADKGGLLDVSTLCRVRVSQFYGIEIDESAAHIARVAMWITDHQLNLEAADRFGTTRPSVPLIDSATIVCGNSLRLKWQDILPPAQCRYVLGNPPFVGHQWRTAEQMRDMEMIWGNQGRFGRLDYVTCWYAKAAEYISPTVVGASLARESSSAVVGASLARDPSSAVVGASLARDPSSDLSRARLAPTKIACAFVSTNSICQGEQVGILWSYLLEQGIHIRFAHRTFQWSNEGKGIAAVHCVIVGFSLSPIPAGGSAAEGEGVIFDYSDNIKGEPTTLMARNINPYLVDAPNVILPSRTQTPNGLPQMKQGSKPVDGGNFLFTEAEKNAFIEVEPQAEKWLRPYIGSEELINGNWRWCLWLKGISPAELRAMPKVMSRIRAVAEMRLKSPTKSVKEFAAQPTRFTQDRQPETNYLAVPEVSSENRRFIPIVFLSEQVIASNKLLTCEGATLYHFGILNSTLHNAWMRYVSGRLKSDYSYSPAVYNNFPWCEPSDKQRAAIELAAQGILDARALYPDSSLADLYDPTAMPPELSKAHAALDKAVDAAYQYKAGRDDAARVAFLFERYQQLTSLLPVITAKKRRKPPSPPTPLP